VVTQLVDALRYNRFQTDAVTGLTYSFSRNIVLGSIQPLTEMSIRNICWDVQTAGA
jgi:hypothetical protein